MTSNTSAEDQLLRNIRTPEDVKSLSEDQLNALCGEIRSALISTVSKTGGHLASNLGVVELTVALHRVFDSPKDQIVWDVGHQCYPHKLLTGRYDRFSTLRTEGGLSGFCRPQESEHDPFISGHSSTSISAALGLAKAKTLRGETSCTIAVIGDGALTGGLAYEALNNAGRSKDRLIVILNDNKMSISRNVGSIARHLASLRSKPGYFKFKRGIENAILKIPVVGEKIDRRVIRTKASIKSFLYGNTIFENMGFAYLGPVDGHDLKTLCNVLEWSKTMRRPVLLHACTVKGKGYSFAESNPKDYHGTSGFEIETGCRKPSRESFSDAFGQELCRLAEADERVCAVTAAMTESTGLHEFSRRFKSRFFDVGIAEEHAITFSSGLAKNGMLPVFAVYSTFLQRGYDELIHDAALQKAHLVLAIDRAGIVGDDGETHQGVFDVSFLSSIPGVTVLAPCDYRELSKMLEQALYRCSGVTAIRYPRGGEPELPPDYAPEEAPYSVRGNASAKTLIVTYGRSFAAACQAQEALCGQGLDVCVMKLNQVVPIDGGAVKFASSFDRIFFFEEGIRSGGAAEKLALRLMENEWRGEYVPCTLPDGFIPQAAVASALKRYRLDADSMVRIVRGETF